MSIRNTMQGFNLLPIIVVDIARVYTESMCALREDVEENTMRGLKVGSTNYS